MQFYGTPESPENVKKVYNQDCGIISTSADVYKQPMVYSSISTQIKVHASPTQCVQ